MEMIRPRLWLGSLNTIKYAPNYINHVGVETIINVAHDAKYFLPGYAVVNIAMLDGWEQGFNPELHAVQTSSAIDTINACLMSGDCIMVHCVEGRSRSPHVIAAYLAEYEGMDYEVAWKEIKSYRTEVHEKSFRERYGVSG